MDTELNTPALIRHASAWRGTDRGRKAEAELWYRVGMGDAQALAWALSQ